MNDELDLSGVDEILAEDQNNTLDLDLSGTDELLAEPSSSDLFSRFSAPSLETAKDFSIGAAKGLTAGSMDEIGGGISAALESVLGYIPGTSAYQTREVDEKLKAQGFNVPEEDIWDKYRGYQQASEQAQKESEERSPYANLAGQFAGGMTGGALLGPALGLGTGAAKVKSISDIARDSGKAKAALELLTRGATSYAKATPLMAAEAAFTSENQLFGKDANRSGLASDVGSNLMFGLPAMLGIQATSEFAGPAIKSVGKKIGAPIESAQQKVMTALQSEDNPRLRQMYKSYKEYGKELGIHPRSSAQEIKSANKITPEEARDILDGRLGLGPKIDPADVQIKGNDVAYSLKDGIAADKLQKGFDSVDDVLGKKVGESINNSTAQINIDPIIKNASDQIDRLANEIPAIAESRKSMAIKQNILSGKSDVSARELKHLIDDVDYSIGVFKRATDLRPGEPEVLEKLYKIRAELSSSLKKNVPEYRNSSEQFESWRQVIEQLIAGGNDPSKAQIFYGGLKKGDQKVQEAILKLIKNASTDTGSSGSSEGREAFTKFMNKLAEFEALDVERARRGLQKVAPDTNQIRKFILSASDDANLRQSVRTTSESRSVVPNLKEAIIGKVPTTGAYIAGRTVKKIQGFAQKPIVKGTNDLARRIYNAPAQSLTNIASKLEKTGRFQSLAKALKESVESGNAYKKNAALFTIMQTPNARILIDDNDLENNEYESNTSEEP